MARFRKILRFTKKRASQAALYLLKKLIIKNNERERNGKLFDGELADIEISRYLYKFTFIVSA